MLRRLVPDAVRLETHDGSGWLGVTPMRVTGLRLRGTLPLPRVSTFLQLNVRTYVTAGGKAGIWFFSLDASSRLAADVARRTYKAPYFHARMSAERRAGWIEFESARARARPTPRVLSALYRPTGETFVAEAGSLDEFLTERYCLYAVDQRGRLHRAEIHHAGWRLRRAEARIELNTMTPEGVELVDDEPQVHFARAQDVVIWPLRRVPDS